MPTAREKQVLFAYKPAHETQDKVPVLAFIIPQAAWDYMKNGLGHDFDLTNVGIPLKIVIGRTKTQATGVAELRKAGLTSEATHDLRDVDVSFTPKTRN